MSSCIFLFCDSAVRGSRKAEQGSGKSVPTAPEGAWQGNILMFVQPVDVCVSPQLQPEQLDCGAAHLQHPLAIVNPVTATPIFTYSGLTAVAVASVNNYTVVFLGTASGGLLKASGAQQQQQGGAAGLGTGWVSGLPLPAPLVCPEEDTSCLLGLSTCFLQAMKESLPTAITWRETHAA